MTGNHERNRVARHDLPGCAARQRASRPSRQRSVGDRRSRGDGASRSEYPTGETFHAGEMNRHVRTAPECPGRTPEFRRAAPPTERATPGERPSSPATAARSGRGSTSRRRPRGVKTRPTHPQGVLKRSRESCSLTFDHDGMVHKALDFYEVIRRKRWHTPSRRSRGSGWSKRRNLRNQSVKSTVRTATRAFRETLSEGDAPKTETALRMAVEDAVCKAATKGVVRKQTAARRISRAGQSDSQGRSTAAK